MLVAIYFFVIQFRCKGAKLMDDSNKSIARRINNEINLRRGYKPTDLLRDIIKFENPNISKSDLYKEVLRRKGNFSTALKGNEKRSISKKELYAISKIFGVSLEYLVFGEKRKGSFIPMGARYVAFQDNEDDYSAYIANLEYEDRIQYGDEFGRNLFDYLGENESINGYKFFFKKYKLHFDYKYPAQLIYVNSDSHEQPCSMNNDNKKYSDNLIKTLAKHNEVVLFRKIYFDNSSLERFNGCWGAYHNKMIFGDIFLDTLLQNDSFLELTLNTKEININSLEGYRNYDGKRRYVEPMFYEALIYALKHESDYEKQLIKMLNYALEYNKSQYVFVKSYLEMSDFDKRDVSVDISAPRILVSDRGIPMGNIFRMSERTSNEEINTLLNEIDQCAFNITHIINKQEKSDDKIKIANPDNPLFEKLHKNAFERNVSIVPTIVCSDKEFTYFRSYNPSVINFDNTEQLQLVIDYLNQAQKLVDSEPNKVLVHGDLGGPVIMKEDNNIVGLAGWQKCHYGNKYEDRAELLSLIDVRQYGLDRLRVWEQFFEVVSDGFNEEEKIKLLDKSLGLVNEKSKKIIKHGDIGSYELESLMDRFASLQLLKQVYLEK